MANHTPQGKKDLDWCLERALWEFDRGNPRGAFTSILSDFSKCKSTQSIDPILIMMIVEPASRQGRDEFIEAVMGFNV